MYQLLTVLARHDLVSRQLPSFSIAFLAASAFYRFGSFALESAAFLATWFAIDAAYGIALRAVNGGRSAARPADREGSIPP